MLDLLFLFLVFGYIPVMVFVAHDDIDTWGFLTAFILGYSILNTIPGFEAFSPILIACAWGYTIKKSYSKFKQRSSYQKER